MFWFYGQMHRPGYRFSKMHLMFKKFNFLGISTMGAVCQYDVVNEKLGLVWGARGFAIDLFDWSTRNKVPRNGALSTYLCVLQAWYVSKTIF